MKLFHWSVRTRGVSFELFCVAETVDDARRVLGSKLEMIDDTAQRADLAACLSNDPYYIAGPNYPVIVQYRKEIHG